MRFLFPLATLLALGVPALCRQRSAADETWGSAAEYRALLKIMPGAQILPTRVGNRRFDVVAKNEGGASKPDLTVNVFEIRGGRYHNRHLASGYRYERVRAFPVRGGKALRIEGCLTDETAERLGVPAGRRAGKIVDVSL